MNTHNENAQPLLTSDVLHRHVERLQREVDLMNKRFELQESEIAYLKQALRAVESRVDFPPAITFCPTCGVAIKNDSSVNN